MPTTNKLKKISFTSIIWDWNGTLLNDLSFCIETINKLLYKRKLPILSEERYKDIFTFPVVNYYKKIGFDFSKEDFALPALEFIDQYNSNVHNCHLHASSLEVLSFFKGNNTRQFILSAMKQDMLEETINQHNVSKYFEVIHGLSDHYAVSKIERGKQLIEIANIKKDEACIIGDTLHDFEVAKELGISCILIANGHQSRKRLIQSKTIVLDSINELTGLFKR